MKFIGKHGKSEKDVRNLRQEIEILSNLRHENIIKMLDWFETKTDFCVVTEFAHGALAAANLFRCRCGRARTPVQAVRAVSDLGCGAALQASCSRCWKTTSALVRRRCSASPSSLCRCEAAEYVLAVNVPGAQASCE